MRDTIGELAKLAAHEKHAQPPFYGMPGMPGMGGMGGYRMPGMIPGFRGMPMNPMGMGMGIGFPGMPMYSRFGIMNPYMMGGMGQQPGMGMPIMSGLPSWWRSNRL